MYALLLIPFVYKELAHCACVQCLYFGHVCFQNCERMYVLLSS